MLTPCLKGSGLDASIRTWIIDGMTELSTEISEKLRGAEGSQYRKETEKA